MYEIWCDNKSILRVLDTTIEPSLVELSKAQGKLVQQTRKLLLQFPHATLNHAQGHQDNNTPYEKLNYQSRLNVDCNRLAKKTMRASTTPTEKKQAREGHRATLYIDDKEVITKFDEQIQYAVHSKSMFQYLCERHEWVDGQLSTINWKAIGLIKNRLSKDQSIRTSKMMHTWLNLGHQKAISK